jgi:hypothetical protein
MSTNRKASLAKRAREMDQKDRVAERQARRTERQARRAERAANGIVGPEMGEPEVIDGGEPAHQAQALVGESAEG